MKRKNPFVSISIRTQSRTTKSTSLQAEGALRSIIKEKNSKRKRASDRATRGSGVFLVNLSRLLVPLVVLFSTTCCTTTSSLSPLGLYKVGIGATNLVDNILNTKSKAATLETTEISTTTEHTTAITTPTIEKQKHKNNRTTNKRRNKNKNTNKKKRRDKNKNSVKRSNSDQKKKSIKSIDQEHPTSETNSVTASDDNNSDMLRIPGLSEDDQKFLDRVQASWRTVQNWDSDEELLKQCRELIPFEELKLGHRATGPRGKDTELSPYSKPETDRLLRACSDSIDGSKEGSFVVGGADSNALFLQRLCRWFQSYMNWVNAPPCSVCGSTDCEMKTVRGPETEEEIEGMAKRVEVYYCPVCKANTTTFPRYNKAAKLLETRKGRCGEYANLFGLFCRSVGFETRLVLDWSDHLWTEVRLGDSWVMADACEGVIDQPSMYEHGWGKDGLSYMIGIGRDHVVDVTPRYTRKFTTEDFQTRRRTHTQSEETSERILQQLNERMRTHPAALPQSRIEELERRRELEEAELGQNKQTTEWTEQDKYGSGRISGSLEWRKSRKEAGSQNIATDTTKTTASNSTVEDEDSQDVAGFPSEAFLPARIKKGKVSFRLNAQPSSRHDGIVVSGTPCAVGVAKSVSVVVLDNNDKAFGCILQSKSFVEWDRVVDFIGTLPSGRIVLMNGKIEIGNETKPEDFYKDVKIANLGGWDGKDVAKGGIIFAGQIDAHPDWTLCKTVENTNSQKKSKDDGNTYELEIDIAATTDGLHNDYKLRTERSLIPQRIAGRLPDAFMPLTQQQGSATEKEKREAYLKFAEFHGGHYCGYTTKKDSPVYLLDSTAYPLQQSTSQAGNISGSDNHTWNTFLKLPEPLVPNSDCGIDDVPSATKSTPSYTVPIDSGFFNSSLGPTLLSNVGLRKETSEVLSNARLIGLYFSAHWCGPCRSFTPMLAEMYDYLTETYPSHGLEIVFVSGDRDEQSFRNYYQSMPWKAIPFDQLPFVKQTLNMTYGVRGIPSFVVLDAVSGEVVVSANESRKEVVTACRGGDLRIEAMFESWLGRTPSSTLELLSMLELSTSEFEAANDDKRNPNHDNIPYLKRTINSSKSDMNQELSVRIKAEFEKLVAAGHDPNTAAAKALTIVSETPKGHHSTSNLPAGSLNGKATYVGKSRIKSHNPVDEALAYALERNPISSVSSALKIAQKYLQNAQRVPWESKFRRFKLSNKVADKITQIEGGLGLIQSVGFEVIGTSRDFEASIPLAADLRRMDATITKLIEDLEATPTK